MRLVQFVNLWKEKSIVRFQTWHLDILWPLSSDPPHLYSMVREEALYRNTYNLAAHSTERPNNGSGPKLVAQYIRLYDCGLLLWTLSYLHRKQCISWWQRTAVQILEHKRSLHRSKYLLFQARKRLYIFRFNSGEYVLL